MILPPSTELRARRSGCHAIIPSALPFSSNDNISANLIRPGSLAVLKSCGEAARNFLGKNTFGLIQEYCTKQNNPAIAGLFCFVLLGSNPGRGSGKREFPRVGKQTRSCGAPETERFLGSPEHSRGTTGSTPPECKQKVI